MITITVKGDKTGVLYQNLSIKTATECIIAVRIMAKIFAASTGIPEQLFRSVGKSRCDRILRYNFGNAAGREYICTNN